MTHLVLLHAVTRDRHDFHDFCQTLPHGLVAHPMDLPGHGDAPRLAHYTVAAMAQAIALPAAAPVVIWGHSLGGLVATAIVAQRPASVRALILEDPPIFDAQQPRLDTTHWARGFRALHGIMTGRGANWSLADWEAAAADWPSGNGDTTIAQSAGPAGVVRRAKQIASLDPNIPLAMVAPGLFAGFDPLAAIKSAPCPITILAGDRGLGSALSDEDVRILAAEHNVRIVPVPGAGHFIREARPDVARAALLPPM